MQHTPMKAEARTLVRWATRWRGALRVWAALLLLLWAIAACYWRPFAHSGHGPRLLIYTPIHLTGLSSVDDFIACVSRIDAVVSKARHHVDVLFLTNGGRALTRAETQRMHRALRALKQHIPQIGKAHHAHIELERDVYDKQRNSSDWVAGPNEVFYRVLYRNGDVYKSFVGPGAYDFVQQLETDVCPIRHGWLDVVIAEAKSATSTSASILGARVASGLICDVSDHCAPASEHPDYMTNHVNGNALYRIDDRLQTLLEDALRLYPEWPFDLASYFVANATNQMQLLRFTSYLYNRVTPVQSEYAYMPEVYGPATYLVHCPPGMRKSAQMKAVLPPLSPVWRDVPVIVVGACPQINKEILGNLKMSLERQNVPDVVWAVSPQGSAAALGAISAPGPVVFAESKMLASTEGCLPALDVIDGLIEHGRSVLYLDGDAVICGDLIAHLELLEPGAVYFASGAAHSHGHFFPDEFEPRYKFSSAAFFMPAANSTRRLIRNWRQGLTFSQRDEIINDGAQCRAAASCAWDGVQVRLLSTATFTSGVNLLKRWPSMRADAVAYIGVAVDQIAGGTRYLSTAYVRPRLQEKNHWHYPEWRVHCCTNVLFADDAHLNDDATTVRAYVNLVLAMHKLAGTERISCVVPPSIIDSRTGERVSYEAIFDATALFHGARVYPSLPHVPACVRPHTAISTMRLLNASALRTTQSWNSWPLNAFNFELRDARGRISRANVMSTSVCLDDSARSVAEAALHLLRGSADAVLAHDAAGDPVFVMGNWRVVDRQLQEAVPNVLTLLSPGLYNTTHTNPTRIYAGFGLQSHYPRLGEDIVFHVLDALACQLARSATQSQVSVMSRNEIYAAMLEFVDKDVLAEEIALTQVYEHDTASDKPFLIPLDSLENNGFSNTASSAQVLAYVGRRSGLRATMVPLSMQHNIHIHRPLADAIDDVARFYGEMRSLRPPIWAMLRHPSLMVEVLNGYMLSVAPIKQWSSNSTCRVIRTPRRDIRVPCLARPWANVSQRMFSPRLFRRVHIAFDVGERDRFARHGHDVVVAHGVAYLGLSDQQMKATLGQRTSASGRDIALRPFRALNFQGSVSHHVAFADLWRRNFVVSPRIAAKAQEIRRHLAPDFTCYHIRVAEEFTVLHESERPHFLSKHVFGLLRKVISAREQELTRSSDPMPGVYITSDVDDPINQILGRSSRDAISCEQHGCLGQKGNVEWGLIDKEVCAAASRFFGNIFSTYTLSICARRRDQLCRDLFGQSLGDGRLLF